MKNVFNTLCGSVYLRKSSLEKSRGDLLCFKMADVQLQIRLTMVSFTKTEQPEICDGFGHKLFTDEVLSLDFMAKPRVPERVINNLLTS